MSYAITLRGEPIVDEQESASAAITPGDLMEIDSGQWRRHAGAGKNAAPVFALERDEMGKSIDTDYAIGDQVKAGYFSKGDRVYAWLPSGQTVAKGAYLESAGDGTLRALATDAATDDTQRASVVAYAAEAVGPTTTKTRIKVVIV